jgi:hypothetical protein
LSAPSEARTRKELIDPALARAGWDVNDPARVRVEIPVDGFDPGAWQALSARLKGTGEAACHRAGYTEPVFAQHTEAPVRALAGCRNVCRNDIAAWRPSCGTAQGATDAYVARRPGAEIGSVCPVSTAILGTVYDQRH